MKIEKMYCFKRWGYKATQITPKSVIHWKVVCAMELGRHYKFLSLEKDIADDAITAPAGVHVM